MATNFPLSLLVNNPKTFLLLRKGMYNPWGFDWGGWVSSSHVWLHSTYYPSLNRYCQYNKVKNLFTALNKSLGVKHLSVKHIKAGRIRKEIKRTCHCPKRSCDMSTSRRSVTKRVILVSVTAWST